MGRASRTYSLTCGEGKSKKQIEYLEGSTSAEILDVVSRDVIEKCPVDGAKIGKLIKDFESQKNEREKPKCFLSRPQGQVTFNSNGVSGRCSFMMNRALSEKFERATKVAPQYQCEHDYFLSSTEKDGTSIYKKTKKGWELDCKAAMQISEPVLVHPSDYYQPEGPHVTPKTSKDSSSGPPSP